MVRDFCGQIISIEDKTVSRFKVKKNYKNPRAMKPLLPCYYHNKILGFHLKYEAYKYDNFRNYK